MSLAPENIVEKPRKGTGGKKAPSLPPNLPSSPPVDIPGEQKPEKSKGTKPEKPETRPRGPVEDFTENRLLNLSLFF